MGNLCIIIFACILLVAASAEAKSFVVPALPELTAGNFNVTNYGASGDGVATNTAAIQAAIDRIF